MEEILPTAEVQEETIMDLVYMIPRILCKYLPAYATFQKSIVYHIPHAYSEEMSQKSEKVHSVVPHLYRRMRVPPFPREKTMRAQMKNALTFNLRTVAKGSLIIGLMYPFPLFCSP